VQILAIKSQNTKAINLGEVGGDEEPLSLFVAGAHVHQDHGTEDPPEKRKGRGKNV